MSIFKTDNGKLGFGFMRLPEKDGGYDMEHTKKMVDSFLEAGFTYFDTAWSYEGCEEALKEALVDRYPRESFTIATKIAPWASAKSREEAIEQFDTSLERTGAGYFDYYLLHNMGEERTKQFEDYKIWDFVKEKKAEGKIKHIGFSAHTTGEEVDEILTAHPEAEFVQLQINYADWEDDEVQSRLCYEAAQKHGVPVIVMEPVRGGMLATPPESVEKILKDANPDATTAEWALKFAADLDGVAVVLSGMSNTDQMNENIKIFKNFKGLNDAERETIEKARKELAEIPIIPCTACDYCAKVCPNNIAISGSLDAMNSLNLYGNLALSTEDIGYAVGDDHKTAKDCIKCGACEKVCPQSIKIVSELEKVSEAFYGDK